MPHRKCDFCSSDYYVRPSTLQSGFGRYCSKSCSNKANNPALSHRIPQEIESQMIAAYQSGKSKVEVGKLFGYGRGGVDKVLKRNHVKARSLSEAGAGRQFTPEWKASIAANHHDVSGKNNPMFGRPPGHGKSVFVPHLNRRVRSTWEAAIAIVLQQLDIEHEYESRRIQVNEQQTYLPDFYLPAYDLYIEVKGWYNKRAHIILSGLAIDRPDIKILVIEQKLYKNIQQDPAVLLEYLQ